MNKLKFWWKDRGAYYWWIISHPISAVKFFIHIARTRKEVHRRLEEFKQRNLLP